MRWGSGQEEDKVAELLGSVFACEQADLEWVDAHEEAFGFLPPPDKRLVSHRLGREIENDPRNCHALRSMDGNGQGASYRQLRSPTRYSL